MADYSPEDLSREIDRLWARVGSVSHEPSAASVPATLPTQGVAGTEVAWETVAILKRQQRQREDTWQRALEAKDESLRVLRLKLESLEAEAGRLRERAGSEDERMLVDALDARQRVETAKKALELAEARHAEENRLLQEAVQQLRERLAAETARGRAAEQRWQAREQQSLCDLKELQALAARREKDAGEADKLVRAHQASLAEAKNALEKTLAELLLERKERERAHAEREAAVKKVDELRKHVDEMSRIWEEERSQWRELWDRERSTWETQRAELATWEESLRREREAWHAELQAKEQAHLRLSESLQEKVRETSQTTERMAGMISAFENRDASERDRATLASSSAMAALAAAKARAARLRRRGAAALAALLLAAAAAACWRWATAWTYELEATAPAPTSSPSALALDGRHLWVADWGGKLTAVEPGDPRRASRGGAPVPGGPYRPTSIAFGPGVFWTLDAAQGRILRHDSADPAKVLSIRPSPGAAPTALAYDGESVWSYDAVKRAVTRHGADDGASAAFPIEEELVPAAMAWADGRLWINDRKSRSMLVYAMKDGRLALAARRAVPDPDMTGFAVAGPWSDRRVFALLPASAARGSAMIARYRVKRRLPF